MKNSRTRILIILKKRHDYDGNKHSSIGLSTGLYNSANFIFDMLSNQYLNVKIVVVQDNNDIDREVSKFKPDYVIIEALWVVPSKFEVLCRLHPKVEWIIRLHSDLSFIANEGIAMKWIAEYVKYPKLTIAANAPSMEKELEMYVQDVLGIGHHKASKKVIYLPNYYPQTFFKKKHHHHKHEIDICCFGAIRPLKNHLPQAFAAIDFAESIGKKLHFHINVGRFEQRGEPVLNNLIAVFDNISEKGHKLIMHEWSDHDNFLALCKKMDIGMQVSFSETFNIVAADLISMGTPIVASPEIPWANHLFCADPNCTKDMKRKLWRTFLFPKYNVKSNQRKLDKYSSKSYDIWMKYFTK